MTERLPFRLGSRFATVEEAMSDDFLRLTRIFDQLAVDFNLPDHADVNRQRYPWSLPYLSSPSLYAARMWEYPYAVKAAKIGPSHRCADIGCGMTPFTIFLAREIQCDVVGVDPDVFPKGIHYKGHGVSREFLERTGLNIVQGGMEQLPLAGESMDRVFCLSVIEHLPPAIARAGIQEMARVLKNGGRAVITVDVNLLTEISRPLDLVWDSGLYPVGQLDLRWPRERFGVFCDELQPADVYGLVLEKDDYLVRTAYAQEAGLPELVPSSTIPLLRKNFGSTSVASKPRSFLRRVAARIRRTWRCG